MAELDRAGVVGIEIKKWLWRGLAHTDDHRQTGLCATDTSEGQRVCKVFRCRPASRAMLTVLPVSHRPPFFYWPVPLRVIWLGDTTAPPL